MYNKYKNAGGEATPMKRHRIEFFFACEKGVLCQQTDIISTVITILSVIGETEHVKDSL